VILKKEEPGWFSEPVIPKTRTGGSQEKWEPPNTGINNFLVF
jgi:hypothetical protein